MSSHLVWIDLEMTGLDPLHDRIIEMATIVTDSDLNVVAEGRYWPSVSPKFCLMAWTVNQSHHSASGCWNVLLLRSSKQKYRR